MLRARLKDSIACTHLVLLFNLENVSHFTLLFINVEIPLYLHVMMIFRLLEERPTVGDMLVTSFHPHFH